MFGARTRDAVIEYQRTKGLTTDGLVGRNTWNNLMEDVVAKGPSNTTVLPTNT